MSHILERDDLFCDFLLCELLSCDVLVFHVIRTVKTSVHTVIGQIQRRKHNDTVAVESLLYLLGKVVHLLYLFGDIARQQNGGFTVCKPRAEGALVSPAGSCLFKDTVDKLDVVLVGVGIGKSFSYLAVVDKFVCAK